jgi:DNA-directed RNA polymerase alpha subunit
MKTENSKIIVKIEKRTTDKKTGQISFQFRVGPFKKSMATTVGNALRRTLLSLSKTVSITSACGNFAGGNCIREDLFELSLNLQRIHIQSAFLPYMGIGVINKKGPAVITAKDLKLDNGLEVINPYQYICTINENYTLNLSVIISSPNLNQAIDPIDPLNNSVLIKRNSLKQRQKQIPFFFGEKNNIFFENFDYKRTKEQFTEVKEDSSLVAKKNGLGSVYLSKGLKDKKLDSFSDSLKENKTKIGSPSKLATEIVVVDPIYSSIQSCGFEVLQTTTSSVTEYEELLKRGVTETDEFLRFVVVSRGAIEPVLAINYALQQLYQSFSILEPLSHIFATERNIFLALEKSSDLTIGKGSRQKVTNLYKLEIVKKLDIKNLNLNSDLELLLRQQGFTTLKSLISVPLEFFKRIGVDSKSIRFIEEQLNRFGLSIGINNNLKWELVPSSLP